MRPFFVLSAVALLVLPFAVAKEPAQPEAAPWVAAMLEARGIAPEDWEHVQVERRVFDDGAWRVETGSLRDLTQPPRAAAPDADVVVGDLAFHIMIQVSRCDGYTVEPVAENVARVGGTWDIGAHVASAQGGDVPGVDTSDPQGSVMSASAHEDYSLAGIGAVEIVENRILLFGTCLVLIGNMNGVGAFAFDQTWPA